MKVVPLAYKIRPKKCEDIVGQDHLVGEKGIITTMIKTNKFSSLIVYGEPGCGKTTISTILLDYFQDNGFRFNASTDNKATLKEIIDHTKYGASILLVVDEIHRMNKDIQDYLLPYVEKGSVILFGITTENPYIACNPAVRSRCLIYRLNEISNEDIKKCLLKAITFLDKTFDDEAIDYISRASNHEVRYAINSLELVANLSDKETITLDETIKFLGKPNLSLDKNGNNYYDLLSAMQKSIRGSNVHASLYYLARLLVLEDLNIICRRLIACAYEDIGLANPSIGPKAVSVKDAVLYLGMPEARLPLSDLVIEMALSPKSNSGLLAIDQALDYVKTNTPSRVPSHLINNPTYDDKKPYLYAHDYPSDIVKQDYMPSGMEKIKFYSPKTTSKFEKAIALQYEALEAFFNNK